MGQNIELKTKDGQTISAYKAEPAGKPRGGIVVIQEIWGVNSHIRDVADRPRCPTVVEISNRFRAACVHQAKLRPATGPLASRCRPSDSRPVAAGRAWQSAAAGRVPSALGSTATRMTLQLSTLSPDWRGAARPPRRESDSRWRSRYRRDRAVRHR